MVDLKWGLRHVRRPLHVKDEVLMTEPVEDPASLMKFTLIGPDMTRGSDAMRPNPLRQTH
jgi:hypothetical protein